jgi:ABC-type nitrate/sulfonate/bicarbonate transport system substrate-binding protein
MYPSRSTRLRLTIAVCGGLLVALTLVASSPATRTPASSQRSLTNVTVAVAGTFLGYGPLYVAQRGAFFKKHGLSVHFSLAAGGPQVLAAILSGDAQFSTTTVTEDANANLHGQSVRIVSPMIRYSEIECFVRTDVASQFPSRKSSLASRVAALKGKTVGVTSIGGGVSIFLSYLLGQAGLSPSDVHMVAIGASPPAWQAAMENKRLDAMCVGLPIGEQVQAAGFATPYIMPGLGDAKVLAGMPETNLVATTDYIKQDPATVKKLVAAMYDAMLFIKKNPAGASRMIKNGFFSALDQSTFDLAWKNFHVGFATTPLVTTANFTKTVTFIKFAIPNSGSITAGQLYDPRFATSVVNDAKKAALKKKRKK